MYDRATTAIPQLHRDGQRRSRYGLYVSRRLDQDIDDLRARLSELEEEGHP